MKPRQLPKSDSIRDLARFWDTHDLTDFEAELEEVIEPVFDAGVPISVRLESDEAESVRRIAGAKGISDGALIREWVMQRLRHNGQAQGQRRSKVTPPRRARRSPKSAKS